MPPLPPMFVNVIEEETQSELIGWLQNFGNVCNFDDTTAFSTSGSIVYGVVRKIFTPVQLQNGMFNCVFIMEQANHLLVPHEEFRILLQFNSPELLRKLEVGSFLAVFNPRLFHVEGMKSFSSGPEGIVWYSVSPVPVSRLKVANEMVQRPVSVSSSLESLKVQSIKKSVIPSFSQPLPSTSTYNRSRGSDDRCNMPPPSTWIDMRKNMRSVGPSKGLSSNVTSRASRSSKTSDRSKRSCSHHSSLHNKSQCSHHSEHHSHCYPPSVTDRHCCSYVEHRMCRCAPFPPPVSCCSHREPPSCHGSVHHSCGSRNYDSCHQRVSRSCGCMPTCSRHECSSSNSPKCSARSICGNISKGNAHGSGPHRACEKSFPTTQEGNQWFVKEWVKQTNSRIGEEKLTFPGRSQDIDSQPLTGQATCGGSVNEELSDDDDNFTSISQILPPVDPLGERMPPTLQRLQQTNTLGSSGSDSSLSDTSTLFLKPTKPLISLKPLVRVDIGAENKRPHGLPATSIDKVMEDNPSLSKDTSSTSESSSSPSNLSLQQVHEKDDESIHNEPISDKCERLNSSMTDDTQKTSSEVFSAPAGPPGGKPSGSDSDDAEIPVQTKKKRKLLGLSDSSWYFDSARRYAGVPSSSNQESGEQLPIKSCEVEEPSSVPKIVTNPADIEVIAPENGEGQNGRVVELTSQESVDIISSSDVEHKSRNERNETCCPKPSVSGMPLDKLVASITEEWASESSSPNSVVPELKTTDRISSIKQVDVEDQVTKDIVEAGALVLVENSPNGCQAMVGINDADLSNDIPLVNDPLPTQCVSVEQSQNSSNILARDSVSTHLSPDSPIVGNETLFDVDMSLCEPSEVKSNVPDSNPTTSAKNPAGDSEILLPPELPELCDKCPIITSNDENQIFETSSPELVEIPTAVDSKSKDLSRQSPNSATVSDGLSEELRPEENQMRISPASTVFYDAVSDNLTTENHLEGQDIEKVSNEDISKKVSIPNQILGVQGTIVDFEPHINRHNPTCIIQGVCRRQCKSRFSYDAIQQLPITTRSCKPCACKSHHVCPSCQENGSKKPLCLEFAFELHVLLGENILRLQVESQEAVKFLGIRVKEFLRKGRRALEIIQTLESLCCTDPAENTRCLTGHIRIKTEQRNDKIVPLLVDTRLEDFKVKSPNLPLH